MALAYVGTPSTGFLSNSSGPLTLTKPSGVASGDLLIIFAAGSSQVSSTPSGFTNDVTSTTTGSRFYHRIADGTEASSFSISYTGAQHVVAVCIAIRGQLGTWQDPVTFPVIYDPLTSGTTCPVPGIALAHAGDWLLGFFCFGQLVAPGTFSLPGDFTQQVAEFKSGTSALDIGMICGDIHGMAAGATGDKTATTAGSANYRLGYLIGVAAPTAAGVAAAAGAAGNVATGQNTSAAAGVAAAAGGVTAATALHGTGYGAGLYGAGVYGGTPGTAAAGVATGTGEASSPVFAITAAGVAAATGIAPAPAFRYAPAGVAAGTGGASAVPLAAPAAGIAAATGVAPAAAGVGFTTGQVPTPVAAATGTAPRAGTAPTHAPAGVASGAGEASHGYAIAFGAPVSGADSLIIDGLIELLNGGVPSVHPVCPGAKFVLVPGYSRGAPQPVTQVVASLLLDGERPTGRRTSNRTISLPVVIYGTSRANLNGARELLMQIVDQDTWQLQWTPDPQGGTALPLIFDCFRATSVEPEYDQDLEDELASRVTVTFPALPFGRSAGLTTLSFPSPSVSWASPPDPLKLDDYATVSSSTQAGWWSQSTQHLADSYSAHWDLSATDGDSPAWYTRTLAAPLDITSLTKLTFNFGLGVPDYRHWHRGNITFAITLNDNTGHSLAFGGGAYCSASNDPDWPNWNKVTFAIPTSATFDYAHLNSYSVKAWRYVDCDGDYRLGGDAYLNGLTALAAAVPSYAAVRGTVYQVGAPGGTARTPMSAQFQATPKTALLTQTWSAAGDYTFLPPAGCYTLKVRAKGATGRGGDRSTSGAGGGAGGGAGCSHDTYPCTPGQPISLHVGAAGTSGGYPTLTASYYVEQDGANRTSLVTPSFTPIAGEILVVKALNGDTAQTFGTPTGGGLTWTSRVNIGTSQFNRSAIWTATAGASPMTVTVSCSGTSEPHAMIVERWGNAKLAGSPATMTSTGSGAPSGTLTTAANNSIVTWLNSDWNAVTGARTYRGTPTEQQYNVVSHYTGYWAYQQAASAGAQTVGLSAPGGQKWSMAGVEIQALNTGALIDGGPSTFDGVAFLAAGGSSVPPNTATGGLGGTTAASTVPAGGVKYRGGNGFTGTTTGGGAGSSAGDDAQGSDAAGQTGATAPTGGINGGNGGAAGGNNAGVVPGGGAFSTGGSAAGANGSDGKIQIWYTPPLTAFKTLIVHAPGFDAPPTLAPLIPAGAGLDPPDNREYTIASPVAGLNARYYGTYTIVAVLSNVDTPSAARTITCTFTQYDFPGGPSSATAVTRTLTPSAESPPIANGVVILGEATLPIRDIADDQTAAYTTLKVTSTNAADRVLDVLALDVRGQLTIINVASGSGFVNYWLDEPDMNRDWGRVLASSYERSQAVSVLDSVLALTGGPLVIDPNGPGWMMAYSHDAGAPALTASFFSRWRDSRLA